MKTRSQKKHSRRSITRKVGGSWFSNLGKKIGEGSRGMYEHAFVPAKSMFSGNSKKTFNNFYAKRNAQEEAAKYLKQKNNVGKNTVAPSYNNKYNNYNQFRNTRKNCDMKRMNQQEYRQCINSAKNNTSYINK
jgi:hypothetical protein